MTRDSALTREEVLSVIRGQSTARRVPMNIHIWVHADSFGERAARVREILAQYPQDIQICTMKTPMIFKAPPGYPDYRWVNWEDPYEQSTVALDQRIALPDWSRIDEVIERFPDPQFPQLFEGFKEPRDSRYRLGLWWFCLFERHWSLRGMADALMDYHLERRHVHKLFRALTDFYLGIIERAAREQKCDGIWTSDDLGTQSGPFFSREIFREYFKPYYKEMIQRCHELGMHFWMHACGNIEPFIGEWIDIGLDVIHPIQKHTMIEADIARRFGGKICFFAGLDVQQVLPWGSAEDVRLEVRRLLDTYWIKGRCMITAGNGINQDCPLDNLEAFFEAAIKEGKRVAMG